MISGSVVVAVVVVIHHNKHLANDTTSSHNYNPKSSMLESAISFSPIARPSLVCLSFFLSFCLSPAALVVQLQLKTVSSRASNQTSILLVYLASGPKDARGQLFYSDPAKDDIPDLQLLSLVNNKTLPMINYFLTDGPNWCLSLSDLVI